MGFADGKGESSGGAAPFEERSRPGRWGERRVKKSVMRASQVRGA